MEYIISILNCRLYILSKWKQRLKTDGIRSNTMEYKVVQTIKDKLFTNITVDLGHQKQQELNPPAFWTWNLEFITWYVTVHVFHISFSKLFLSFSSTLSFSLVFVINIYG